jgi:hypothetical protein
MPSAYDVMDVTGLRTYNSVLLVGGKQNLTVFKKITKRVEVATKSSEVDRLIGEGRKYDKVFLMAGGFPSLLPASVKLLKGTGLLAFVNDDKLIRETFVELVKKNFVTNTIFESESDIGYIVGCHPKGCSRWEVR